MPRYHFNLADHVRDEDTDGTEFASVAEARVEAVVFAAAYLKDSPELLRDDHEFRVEVTDDDGSRVFTVAMRGITPGGA